MFKFNLQRFAEEGTTGADNGNGGEPTQTKTLTFDEMLSNKEYQSEFDKRVAKALETAKGKWQSEYDQKIEDARTEAAKLAKMNAEQKAKYEEDKRVEELNKREKDITARELKAVAYESLAEKGLPKSLADILNYTDADACNKSIEAVGTAFQTAVEQAVNEKLRGTGAPKGAFTNPTTADTDKMTDAEYYAYIKAKQKG